MFEVGEFVVYGNKGVCRIKGIGPIDLPGVSKDRVYYTMEQVYTRGSTIFTPADSDKLRRVLTKDEACELIDAMTTLNPQWIKDDKEREKIFTEALRTANCKALCEMIIALCRRKEERIAGGKKATSTDERYFHAAEDILYGELVIALGKGRDEVKECVLGCVH